MFSYNKEPDMYWRHLEDRGLLDKIYAAIAKDDLAELCVTVLDILKQSNTMPTFDKHIKAESKSNSHREAGNLAYGAQQYKTALECYNKALLYAPDHSKAMKLAYSNRSALLFKLKAYSACLKDIDTCFSLGCTPEIVDKLKQRKTECQSLVKNESNPYDDLPDNYFNFNVPRHPDVQCVSTDVEFIKDDIPKAVAACDIKVGTVVAIEPAFTTLLNPDNHYICCYHCHKTSLNLKPCKECCFALFCDDDCRKKCIKESHKIECYIMSMTNSPNFGPYSRISFRTILKIKSLSKSWQEFIDASHSVGEARMSKSTLSEIYDHNNPYSILSFAEVRQVKISSLYNFSFYCANFIDTLMDVPLFFPLQAKERDDAMRAVARMTMRLILFFYNKIELDNNAFDGLEQQIKPLSHNYGYFSFMSKLRHACDANLLHVALNDKVALMAMQPIKKGKELTICYIDHAFQYMFDPEHSQRTRIMELYRFGILCQCPFCTGSWKFKPRKLNKDQRKCFEKWLNCFAELINPRGFDGTCKALEVLNGMSHTKEYHIMYIKFMSMVQIYQYLATKNTAPFNTV